MNAAIGRAGIKLTMEHTEFAEKYKCVLGSCLVGAFSVVSGA